MLKYRLKVTFLASAHPCNASGQRHHLLATPVQTDTGCVGPAPERVWIRERAKLCVYAAAALPRDGALLAAGAPHFLPHLAAGLAWLQLHLPWRGGHHCFPRLQPSHRAHPLGSVLLQVPPPADGVAGGAGPEKRGQHRHRGDRRPAALAPRQHADG